MSDILAVLSSGVTTQPAANTTTANSASGTLTAGTAANIGYPDLSVFSAR